jgi:hypothetical protein
MVLLHTSAGILQRQARKPPAPLSRGYFLVLHSLTPLLPGSVAGASCFSIPRVIILRDIFLLRWMPAKMRLSRFATPLLVLAGFDDFVVFSWHIKRKSIRVVQYQGQSCILTTDEKI